MGADESKIQVQQTSLYGQNRIQARVPTGAVNARNPFAPHIVNSANGASPTPAARPSVSYQPSANGASPTPAARPSVSYQPSTNVTRVQTTASSSANTERVAELNALTNNHIYSSLQKVKSVLESSEHATNAVASGFRTSNTPQRNPQPTSDFRSHQQRSVEENVKNFDDAPEIDTILNQKQGSEPSNVSSNLAMSSTAKTGKARAKNIHNKGIAKQKFVKKNAQGNKADVARSTISEIENGFNLVTLQDNGNTNKNKNTKRAEQTQAPRNKVENSGLSLDSFLCQICMEPMLGAVFQCVSGHTLCESCNEKLREPICPTCRIEMSHPIRNRHLEEIISKILITCPNKEKGCIYKMPGLNMRDHLDECIYRNISCPIGTILGRCFWEGGIKELKEHFQNVHPNESGFEPDVEMTVQNINVDDRMVSLIVMGNFNFLLHVKVDMQQRRTYWLIQCFGTKKGAKNWTYEFHFYNKNEPGRKLFYSDRCSSDSENANTFFENRHCAIVPFDVLETFFNAGKLNYKFYIKKMGKERNKSADDASSEADPSENQKKGRNNNKKK